MNRSCAKCSSNSMVSFIFLFFFSLSQFGKSQTVTNNLITIGRVDSIQSKILNEERKVWVYIPNNTNTNPAFAKMKFPVVYLLDGDAFFPSAMGMIQQLSEVNGNSVCPNMIIVGIVNTDRMRDLTPTRTTLESPVFATSGRAGKFTDFIEKELMPHIDSLYPTTPYRMLIGHSLGGLMVLNTLTHRPHLFNSYVAIDPSLWWDNHKLLDESAEIFRKQDFNGQALVLAMSNSMPAGFDTATVRKDAVHTPRLDPTKRILEFADLLKINAKNGLRWDWKYYKNENHGSVPLIAQYDALNFLFDGHKLPLLPFNQPHADSLLTEHYKNISKMMGYVVLPPQMMINRFGYDFLQNKMMDKAYRFFKMNIDNYPESSDAYDCMGDYYIAKGDKEKAAAYFTKALEFYFVPETKKKLDELKLEK